MLDESEDIVTAFNIEAVSETGIDYEKLIKKFGCYAITPEMVAKIEALTGKKPHRLLRRGVFFCHRDLDIILSHYEKN
jgi:tryptophanyl-tRNA synthetase